MHIAHVFYLVVYEQTYFFYTFLRMQPFQVMNTPLNSIPKAAIFPSVQRMQEFSNW